VVLSEDAKGVAVDDVVFTAVVADATRHRRVDDYLVSDFETGNPFPDGVDHSCGVGTTGVGQMFGGGHPHRHPDVQVVESGVLDLDPDLTGPGLGLFDIVERVGVDPLGIG